jgi:transcription-repair coupling factor (superfamily II helicase)
MPVTIGYLNRFRSAKQKAETLKDLSEGKLDIIERINWLIKRCFKDLGLLIVDEERNLSKCKG